MEDKTRIFQTSEQSWRALRTTKEQQLTALQRFHDAYLTATPMADKSDAWTHLDGEPHDDYNTLSPATARVDAVTIDAHPTIQPDDLTRKTTTNQHDLREAITEHQEQSKSLKEAINDYRRPTSPLKPNNGDFIRDHLLTTTPTHTYKTRSPRSSPNNTPYTSTEVPTDETPTTRTAPSPTQSGTPVWTRQQYNRE